MDSNETVRGFPNSSIFKFASQSTSIKFKLDHRPDIVCKLQITGYLTLLYNRSAVVKPPGFEALCMNGLFSCYDKNNSDQTTDPFDTQ